MRSKQSHWSSPFLLMTVCLKSSLTQCYIWPDQIWIRSLTSDRKVITTLEKSLQGKESQIQQLEKQLADMSHLHQTEIVKLRLEVGRSNICAKRGGAERRFSLDNSFFAFSWQRRSNFYLASALPLQCHRWKAVTFSVLFMYNVIFINILGL